MEGELDNRTPGWVTGWIRFAGKKEKVQIDLKGDFHPDAIGTQIAFLGKATGDEEGAGDYMKDFSECQTGEVGEMLAGLEPEFKAEKCCLEWYSEENGRVLIELDPKQIEVTVSLRPSHACGPC
jgi:hypothetical protein